MINCSSKKLQVMDGVDKLRLSKVEVLHLPGLKAYVPGSSGAVGPDRVPCRVPPEASASPKVSLRTRIPGSLIVTSSPKAIYQAPYLRSCFLFYCTCKQEHWCAFGKQPLILH